MISEWKGISFISLLCLSGCRPAILELENLFASLGMSTNTWSLYHIVSTNLSVLCDP